MKLFNACFLVFVLAVLIMMTGCTNTPTETKRVTYTQDIALNADEQKSYQDALEAIKLEQLDKATTMLAKIVNNHPEHLGANINLGNAYFKQMKIAEAETILAHVKTSNVAEVYNLQGLIDVSKGDYVGAEKNYLNALQLKQNYSSAHYNLALLYDIYYQDVERAVAQYERYLELSDGSDKKTIGWVAELKQKIKRRTKS